MPDGARTQDEDDEEILGLLTFRIPKSGPGESTSAEQVVEVLRAGCELGCWRLLDPGLHPTC